MITYIIETEAADLIDSVLQAFFFSCLILAWKLGAFSSALIFFLRSGHLLCN